MRRSNDGRDCDDFQKKLRFLTRRGEKGPREVNKEGRAIKEVTRNALPKQLRLAPETCEARKKRRLVGIG